MLESNKDYLIFKSASEIVHIKNKSWKYDAKGLLFVASEYIIRQSFNVWSFNISFLQTLKVYANS